MFKDVLPSFGSWCGDRGLLDSSKKTSKIKYLRIKLIYSQIIGLEFRNQKAGTDDYCCDCYVLLVSVMCDGIINGNEEVVCACLCVRVFHWLRLSAGMVLYTYSELLEK